MNRTSGKIAIYAGTAAGVFWLPFYVPILGNVFSISQVFHFNNLAAIVALLAGIALAAWWSWRNPDADSPALSELDHPLGWRPLLLTLVVSGLWLTLVCLATWQAPLS